MGVLFFNNAPSSASQGGNRFTEDILIKSLSVKSAME
jgi:hypothetical protein